MLVREYAEFRQEMRVTFSIPDSLWGDQIAVVGDFNNWNPFTHILEARRGEPNLSISVVLPLGQNYRFVYLVDGERVLEPAAAGVVDDIQNGPVSLLIV